MANSTMAGRKEVKRMKKILSVVLACILSISCCTVNGQAIYADTEPPQWAYWLHMLLVHST